MNNFNQLVSAKEMENVTATSATVRFQDFELRTLAAIEKYARQGYDNCARNIDIPYGITMYNDNMRNFLKRLNEAGYYALVVHKNYHGARTHLYISWTDEGKRKIDEFVNSPNVSVRYYGEDK